MLAQPSPDKYKAVKMPRGDYVRYFRHNAQGHYAGTEPEREWDEEEIMEKYGQYQDLPLRSILGRTTPHDAPFPVEQFVRCGQKQPLAANALDG